METIPVRHGLRALLRGDIQAGLNESVGALQQEIDSLRAERDALAGGNEAVIRGVIDRMLESTPESGDIVRLASRPVVEADGADHAHMPLLVTAAQGRIPAWLHGEAGSGKSTAAEKVADRERLDFRSISLCPTTSKSDLLGYRDASGQYRSTAFRDTYEHGGVFLFDEIDNAHPSSLALINHALANTVAEFPDKKVERHPDAIIVAAANTIGRGANAQYVGRAVIDAATRDRFVYIPWDIDDALEEYIADPSSRVKAHGVDISEGGVPTAKEWLGLVRAHRQAIEDLGIRHLCSPRATIYGITLARLGMGRRWLKELCIFKGMPDGERTKIDDQLDRSPRSSQRFNLAR